jgi:hypothetical protein
MLVDDCVRPAPRSATARAPHNGRLLHASEQTIADTLAWANQAEGPVLYDGIGLSEERDAELLAALASKGSVG